MSVSPGPGPGPGPPGTDESAQESLESTTSGGTISDSDSVRTQIEVVVGTRKSELKGSMSLDAKEREGEGSMSQSFSTPAFSAGISASSQSQSHVSQQQQHSQQKISSSAKKYEITGSSGGFLGGGGGGGGGGGSTSGLGSSGDVDPEFEEYSEDDTEVSSEAIVDDIELILMPEEVEDLPDSEQRSPKLVRVTELYTEEYVEEDFLKMDDEDGNDNEDNDECMAGDEEADGEEEDDEPKTQGYDEEDQSTTENLDDHSMNGKRHSGVQTDISALEKDGDYDDHSYSADNSERFDFRRRKTLTLTGVGIGAGGDGLGRTGSGRLGSGNPRGKKLNWKSELTLLPSKTKLGCGGGAYVGGNMGGSAGFGSFSYANNAGYGSGEPHYSHDQYSARVAKFTSQDNVMSSSSQFLKPSTLYRTRNLSRNLNHFASSEFMQDQLDSPRYRVSNTALSASSTNYKGSASHSSHPVYATTTLSSARRRPAAKTNFRQSLPDLSSTGNYQDNNRRRQTQFGGSSKLGGSNMKYSHRVTSAGLQFQKKSSSDDETSSLIDESERCLRSSIDLLLTDDYPSPGCDYPYLPRSSGGTDGFGQQYAASSTSGYYSARRSCSQPLLTDQAFCGEPRDSALGSPFLPRKLSDMRCSRWAKVILPNGLVAVVSVKEMDEFRDCLTVHTETGCIVSIPFRKVVFAWRIKR